MKDKNFNFNLRDDYTFPIDIKLLRKCSYRKNINEEKVASNYDRIVRTCYSFGLVMNYLSKRDTYEVCCSITMGKETVGSLMYKEFNSKVRAKFYYFYLKLFLNYKKIIEIKEKMEQKLCN